MTVNRRLSSGLLLVAIGGHLVACAPRAAVPPPATPPATALVLAEAVPAPPADSSATPSPAPSSSASPSSSRLEKLHEQDDRDLARMGGWVSVSAGSLAAIVALFTSYAMLHDKSVRDATKPARAPGSARTWTSPPSPAGTSAAGRWPPWVSAWARSSSSPTRARPTKGPAWASRRRAAAPGSRCGARFDRRPARPRSVTPVAGGARRRRRGGLRRRDGEHRRLPRDGGRRRQRVHRRIVRRPLVRLGGRLRRRRRVLPRREHLYGQHEHRVPGRSVQRSLAHPALHGERRVRRRGRLHRAALLRGRIPYDAPGVRPGDRLHGPPLRREGPLPALL